MNSATSDPAPRILIVGCGYTGLRLARRLIDTHEVIACVASAASAQRIAALGIATGRLDLDEATRLPVSAAWLDGATVCNFVPPPAEGDTDPRSARLLELLPGSVACLVYLSTTGVYGDRAGAVVTEDSPIQPATARARRRADAEERISAWCATHHVRAVVLRVPGIYGPGRLPLERLRRGDPVLHSADAGPGNRIHVDDLVAACRLVMGSPAAAGTYNVGDGHHASSSEYFSLVARLAGLPAPPAVPLAQARRVLSPQMLSFLTESRRVSTARIRAQLGFRPRFADLAAGIRASLAEEASVSVDRP